MSSPDRSRPDPSRLRVGDAERERAAALLAEQYAQGRLDDREHAERLDAVWSSRTRADLDVLFHDLPATPSGAHPATTTGRSGRTPSPAPASAGPGPWVLVLAVLGVVFVLTKVPWVLLGAAVVLFVALKRHRRRQRELAGPPLWH